MKKKLSKFLFLAVAAALFSSPAISLAEENSATGAQETRAAVCAKIMEKLSGVQQKMISWQTKIQNRENSIKKEIEKKRENRISQLGNIRTKWDKNLEDHFEKLREKASTNEEKAAVETFISAVEAARKIRKDAFDQAVKEFQTELDKLIASKQANIQQKTQDYKNAVNKAYSDAKTACDQGTALSEIQTDFRNALSQAKEQYRNKVKPAENYVNEMQALVKEKREAIKAATDTYHDAIDEAISALRKVFNPDEKEGNED